MKFWRTVSIVFDVECEIEDSEENKELVNTLNRSSLYSERRKAHEKLYDKTSDVLYDKMNDVITYLHDCPTAYCDTCYDWTDEERLLTADGDEMSEPL